MAVKGGKDGTKDRWIVCKVMCIKRINNLVNKRTNRIRATMMNRARIHSTIQYD